MKHIETITPKEKEFIVKLTRTEVCLILNGLRLDVPLGLNEKEISRSMVDSLDAMLLGTYHENE